VADDLAAALVRELAAALPEPLNPEFVDVIGRLVVEVSRDANQSDRAPRSELLTVAEVAARLRVSPKWVYAHQHELGPIRLGDGPKARLRFDAGAVEARMRADESRRGPSDAQGKSHEQQVFDRPRRRRLKSRPLPAATRSHPRA
jgi:hypothetical protein